MHIERMHKMIECLCEKAWSKMENGLECVDTAEMGQVVDMIKDLNDAEYKAVITKAMQKAEKEDEEEDKEILRRLKSEYGEGDERRFYDHYRYANGRFAPKGRGTRRGYTEPPYYFQTPDMYHEWDSKSDAERGRDLDRMGGRMYYTEPMMSGYDKAKRHYTESKEMHKGNSQADKEQKMRDLEAYMKELSGDVTEILSDMTPEERTLLKAKMTTLLQKIG